MLDHLHGKLARFQKSAAGSIVELDNPGRPTASERRELLRALTDFNFVIYQVRSGPLDKAGLKTLGTQLGIDRTDHNFCADGEDVSSVQVSDRCDRPRYIPYSDRPLGWHTDGYYYGSRSGGRRAARGQANRQDGTGILDRPGFRILAYALYGETPQYPVECRP